MADVYRARDYDREERLVAVKEFKKRLGNTHEVKNLLTALLARQFSQQQANGLSKKHISSWLNAIYHFGVKLTATVKI